MTNVAISGLPAAGTITGAELVPIVQSGVTSRTTISAIPGTYIDARSYAIDPTGTTDSSVGGNLAIIDAINHKKPLIWPSGIFLLNGPLLAFIGVTDSFQMYGQGGAAPTSNPGVVGPQKPPSSYPSNANTIFYTSYTNSPAIITNSGRGMVLKDFSILGQNIAPSTAISLSTGPALSQAAYISSGCQNGRYAPYCAIAFDPFSNSTAQTITSISKATAAVVTVNTGSVNPFVVSQNIIFANVVGMTQINGLTGTVTSIGGSLGAWTATVNINSSAFSSYTSGGTAVGLPYNIGTISNIVSQSTSTVVTFSTSTESNPFQCGENVAFSGVVGMTQINGLSGKVTATSGTGPGTWAITVNINSSSFSTYTSGGQAVASDAYISLASYYQSANAGDGTYGCVVENVSIACFTVGIAIGLSGTTALAADLTFRNVSVSYCDVCYAIGQSQSRNLNIEYGNITNARTGIDGLNYGSLGGTPPMLLRPNFGFLYRIFALNQSVGNCVINDGYAESIVCLGQYGLGSARFNTSLTFIGGDYEFGYGGATWNQAPLLLETYGITSFRGTGLGFANEIDALNFVSSTAPITFDHCCFSGTSLANVAPQVGLTYDAGNGGYCRFLDCWVNGEPGGPSFVISDDLGRSFGVAKFNTAAGRLGATYQTYRVSNGNSEYLYLPYSSLPSIPVAVTGLSYATGSASVTITCTSASVLQLLKGDILFWTLLPQGSSLNAWTVPALTISSISGTTVTCSLLFDPMQYANAASQVSSNTIYVAPNHWAPTQSLTCSTSNGSTTLTSVTPTTILQNGDFIAGANLPANSRVVSGGGSATVTISQAATSTATAVALYFGRLNAITYTPLY